jgi:L-serine deaminase
MSTDYAALARKANAALRGTKTARKRARTAARARWREHNEKKAIAKQQKEKMEFSGENSPDEQTETGSDCNAGNTQLAAIQQTQTDDITDIWFTT